MELKERIYDLRRKAGLSQEELAGKLGVSRQAVGKWENGTSMPDVNNLIELSKIFGVSLAELLGMDEKRADTDGSIDRQLQEFLEKYTFKMRELEEHYEAALHEQQEREAEHRKTQNKILCALAAAVIILGIVSGWRIAKLGDRISEYESSTNNEIVGLNSYIIGLQSRIEQLEDAQNSLFSDFTYDVTDYDQATGKVSFTISVVPKSIRDDTKVDFCISSYEGNEQITVTGTRKGMAFAAEGTLPAGNYYITVLLTENGTQKAENLGGISVSPLGLAALYSFDWYTSPDYSVLTDASGCKCHPCGLLVLECMEGTLPPRRADSVELVMYKNGEEVTCLSLDTQSQDKWQDSFTLPKGYGVKASSEVEEAEADYIIEPDRMFYVSEFDFGELDAQIGDEFRIELVVRDTLGLTYRESELDSFKFISETSVTGSSTTHGYLELDSDLID